MFKNLTQFSYKRTPLQALGFYIAYLILIALVAGIMGAVIGLAIGSGDFETGFRFGNLIAIVSVIGLSFLILKSKNLMGNFALILVALLSGVLAYFGGGLLGLIPAAYLSTR